MFDFRAPAAFHLSPVHLEALQALAHKVGVLLGQLGSREGFRNLVSLAAKAFVLLEAVSVQLAALLAILFATPAHSCLVRPHLLPLLMGICVHGQDLATIDTRSARSTSFPVGRPVDVFTFELLQQEVGAF